MSATRLVPVLAILFAASFADALPAKSTRGSAVLDADVGPSRRPEPIAVIVSSSAPHNPEACISTVNSLNMHMLRPLRERFERVDTFVCHSSADETGLVNAYAALAPARMSAMKDECDGLDATRGALCAAWRASAY